MRFLIVNATRKMSSKPIVDLSSLRMKYMEKKELFLESSIEVKAPIDLFKKWLNEACETPEILEPNAVCLATATKSGIPSSRYVLMKSVTDIGFTFFTNYGSRKAMDIAENPNVAMTFYWTPLRRQVRVEGVASKLSIAESENYFNQRPRASQIGAVVSPQSQPIPSRQYLDDMEAELKSKLGPDGDVSMPNWGGYLVTPHAIEFWQGQTNRLHDRIVFRRSVISDETSKLVHPGEKGWVYERLAP